MSKSLSRIPNEKFDQYLRKILRLVFWFLLLAPLILIPLYYFLVSLI